MDADQTVLRFTFTGGFLLRYLPEDLKLSSIPIYLIHTNSGNERSSRGSGLCAPRTSLDHCSWCHHKASLSLGMPGT